MLGEIEVVVKLEELGRESDAGDPDTDGAGEGCGLLLEGLGWEFGDDDGDG